MTAKEQKDFMQMYNALKRIGKYQTLAQLERNSKSDWGLSYDEALEMAYENIQSEAKQGLINVRLPNPSINKQ